MRLCRKALVPIALFAVGLCDRPVSAQTGYTVGSWAASPMGYPAGNAGKADETLRETVHVSLGSTGFVSIELSNEFGTDPLTIGAATIAQHSTGNGIQSPVALTFGGNASVTIAPGDIAQSDPVHFTLPAKSDLTVSLFVPAQTISTVTQHGFANSTNYIAPGNQTSAPTLTDARETGSWRFLREVEVSTANARSIVCLGDSITDGSRSTKDANLRWPDLLAARLQADPKTSNLSVLNQGIGGNRILHDVTGPSAISRFDRDVLNSKGPAVQGLGYLVILEGINDIGHAADPVKPYDQVSADELIAAYRLLAVRGHAHFRKVFGATLTPYIGAKYASPGGEKNRQALNTWIRTTKELDGVIDFDKATRDPAHPDTFLPAYDSGDHLHPNDAGMKAMADAIDLKLFEK